MIRSGVDESESVEDNNSEKSTEERGISTCNDTFLPATDSNSLGNVVVSPDQAERTSKPAWNRTEHQTQPPMATPNSPVRKTFVESTYNVLKRRTKVAKGVQTDQVRKRCWRHSRSSSLGSSLDPNGNEGTSMAKEIDLPHAYFTPMSTLRSALPNMTFPRWNRTNKIGLMAIGSLLTTLSISTHHGVKRPKLITITTVIKSSVVSGLTERYLSSLYRPFGSVRRQLTEQALQRCQAVGSDHFEAHYLGPTALFLRTVKDTIFH